MDKIRQNVFPILTALIWGTAFSAQSQCAAAGMQTFTFNMLRSVIGCIVLVPVMLWFSGGPKNTAAAEGYNIPKKSALGRTVLRTALDHSL